MASRCASTVAPALRLHGTRWLSGVPAGLSRLTPASRDALACNTDADILLVLSNDGHNTVAAAAAAAAAAATPLFPLAIRLWASAASSDACCGAGRRRWALPHDPRWQLPPAGAIPRKNLLAACSATAAATCGTPRRAGTPSPGTCLVSWDPEWPSSLNSEPRCKVRTLVLRPISLSHRPL